MLRFRAWSFKAAQKDAQVPKGQSKVQSLVMLVARAHQVTTVWYLL